MPKNTYSIIIPTLNEEKCLPALLKNLSRQTDRDFEVIIVDGHSEDKTKSKAETFKGKLNLSFFEVEKRNVSYQRNFGANVAKSEILIFLDADTLIPSNFIKKVKDAFKSKKADLLTTYIKTDEKGIKPIETGTNIIFEVTRLMGSPALYGSMLAVRKKAFKQVHGFDEKLRYKEDSKLAQDIYKEGYKYIVLSNTYYYWSLRRFRKLGVLRTLQNYIILNFNKTFDYQMGGHLFIENTLKKVKRSRPKEFEKRFNIFVERLLENFRLK